MLTLLLVWALGPWVEGNPLMGWLLGVSPLLFVVVKLCAVAWCSVRLTRANARWALAVLCVVYAATCAYSLHVLTRS